MKDGFACAYAKHGDELDQLAKLFNEMLERIEKPDRGMRNFWMLSARSADAITRLRVVQRALCNRSRTAKDIRKR